MDDFKINFSPLGVMGITFLTFIATIIAPIVILILCIHAFEDGKVGAIYFFVGFLFFDLLILSLSFIFFNAFIAFVRKKPAILLTKDFYIDNIQNVKVSWSDISTICIWDDNDSFLKIAVSDNSIIYQQAKNNLSKFRFWNISWKSKWILSVNMNLLQGKNKDILNDIKNYQQKIINLSLQTHT